MLSPISAAVDSTFPVLTDHFSVPSLISNAVKLPLSDPTNTVLSFGSRTADDFIVELRL